VNAGTTPAPSISYFATELFKSMAGIDLTIVSYRGTVACIIVAEIATILPFNYRSPYASGQ